jgi:hypothetical protein
VLVDTDDSISQSEVMHVTQTQAPMQALQLFRLDDHACGLQPHSLINARAVVNARKSIENMSLIRPYRTKQLSYPIVTAFDRPNSDRQTPHIQSLGHHLHQRHPASGPSVTVCPNFAIVLLLQTLTASRLPGILNPKLPFLSTQRTEHTHNQNQATRTPDPR